MAMGSVLLAGGAAYAAHRVNASAVQLGSEILTNIQPMNGAESVSFNGAHFYFGTQLLDRKLEDVLTGAEVICRQEGADLQRDLGPTLAKVPTNILPSSTALQADFSNALTTRKNTEKEGEVACWVRRSRGPQRSILDRVTAFAESMDLSELGSLQFVHAEAVGNRTLVRMIWSEGPLSVRDMFPDSRDVPGHDLPGLPRPVGSFRVVSAHVEGAGRGIVSYQSALTSGQLNAFYTGQMKSLGWQEVDLGEGVGDGALTQHAYQKGERTALLALTPGEQFTNATFIELPPK